MNFLKALIALLVVGLIGAVAFVYFGVFNVAADVPHWPLVHQLMETTRQRSIAVRARGIRTPPLDNPKLIAEGAEHYNEMCTGCHLAPGMTDSEIRPGLYPQPPNLSQALDASPAEMFWAIKHGIKMSAMPAWGATHDDDAIWGMVAFIHKLPEMTPEQYKAATRANGEGGSEENSGHEHHHHGGGDENGHHDDHDHNGGEADHHHGGDSAAGEETAKSAHEHDHREAASVDKDEHAAASPEAPLSLDGLKAKAVPEAEEVASAFHSALQRGDRNAVLALLSADVTVTESGHTQSRKEYASGHLGQDIAFLKTAQVRQISMASMPMGESAMVGSESEIHTKGTGQSKILRSRELLTLKREGEGWKIVAVRWQ